MSKAAVQELLLEMKDTSELMVDLAYSAVFYGSKQLAQEVHDLEEAVGEQFAALQRTGLEAVRERELSVDEGIVLMRTAQTAEIIANSALEIADVVLRGVGLHPVLAASIQGSDSSVTKVTFGADSAFAGRSLREQELETETGMRILAVRRGKKWHTRIGGGFTPAQDDLIIAVGPEASIEPFQRAAIGSPSDT